MLSLLKTIAQISSDDVNLPNTVDPGEGSGFVSQQLQGALQLAFGILGAIALLVIVIAALQYVLSAGDAQKVARAKDTIIYALVGLVVAVMAFAIVTFVLDGAFS